MKLRVAVPSGLLKIEIQTYITFREICKQIYKRRDVIHGTIGLKEHLFKVMLFILQRAKVTKEQTVQLNNFQ